MLNRLDLQKLAQVRLDESLLLQANGLHSGAYYLAGYAIELALKACIARLMQADVIPDKGFIDAIYTHRLDSLLSTAGLKPAFDGESKNNPQFAAYWAIVTKWTEKSRYDFWDPLETAALLEATGEPSNGIFQWVKKHW